MTAGRLRPLVGDLRQIASVRKIVLDDGPETGVRALAFSSGGGLDFWVLSDRSLDIGTVAFRGVPMAWQAPAGFRSPALTALEGDGGMGFNRSFSGFLVTCGLDHIRRVRNGHPQHGRLPYTPARVTAYGESWERGAPLLFCEGEVVQARYGGEALRLRRRVEAPIGGATLRILDEVENLSDDAGPQALLYHFNLGFPAIGGGSTVGLDDRLLLGPIELPETDGAPHGDCHAVDQAARRTCTVATPHAAGRLGISFAFDTASLPYLQIWRDLRPGIGVLAIEPCTSDRGADGASGPEPVLPGGERRRYGVEVGFAGDAPKLGSFD
ncbi:MAG: DUF4432 family protein [Hyphomicrobiales bacterium]